MKMSATDRMILLFIVLLALTVPSTWTAEMKDDDLEATASEPRQSTILSPAEELLNAAMRAGYNLTIPLFDLAAASSDEEVIEMMPAPVAEAFIGHRRRDNVDLIREQMIGMIFTGKPQVLGPRPRRPLPPPPPNHRPRIHMRPNPTGRLSVHYNPQGEDSIQHSRKVPAPDNILKPLPFVPGPTMVKFPSHSKFPQNHPHSGPRQRPRPPLSDNFHHVGDKFGNTVGPDFGPVTFSHVESNSNPGGFSNNFDNDFDGFRPPKDSFENFNPPKPPRRNPTRRPSRPNHSRPKASGGSGGFSGNSGECVKYTEDICLDTFEYPHEAILSSLIRDPSRSDTMIAEVRSQSADELVDGVSSNQESKYDYQHYFGNRRAGTENHAHRDFASDGGYLCPSEVKYARPKRARNSKGKWKYIVNMDKYSQTIRMEKCMKPGGACSYVSHHYRATCNQVYNYHRLLSWEDGRGLHMDIFKVPSCCSCHIQGYAYVFPPLNNRRQHSSGSIQVTQEVRAPPSDTNAVAPGSESSEQAYSPINYPNLPTNPIRRRRPGSSRPGIRRPGPGTSFGMRTNSTRDINRSDDSNMHDTSQDSPTRGMSPERTGPIARRPQDQSSDEDRVNYGYHPIIDFFNPYSFEDDRQR